MTSGYDDDSTEFPYAQDLDGIWHRRPAGDWWLPDIDGPQCRTRCGMAIASVNVSACRPDEDAATGSTLCPCVDEDPGDSSPDNLKRQKPPAGATP